MKKFFKWIVLLGVFLAIVFTAYKGIFYFSNNGKAEKEISNSKVLTADERAEQLLSQMSLSEKIGQMVFMGIQNTKYDDDINYMLNQYHIGGVILFDRNLENEKQVKTLISNLQENAHQNLPLFIGIDEEGGSVARMKNIVEPPPAQQEIGAAGNTDEAKKWAFATGKKLKSLGFNVNFAPVLDVGTQSRAYSSQSSEVIKYAEAAGNGYTEANIIYAIKHFPGIGKGKADSHLGTVVVNNSKEELYKEDIDPFKKYIKNHPQNNYMVLVSHVSYPALDPQYPASVSKKIITGILREELGYDGVIITDDLEMNAVSKKYSFREAGVKAVLAGVDIVLICHEYEHITDIYLGLLDAAEQGIISEERINRSVRRILKMKLMNNLSEKR